MRPPSVEMLLAAIAAAYAIPALAVVVMTGLYGR
ncbi:MAG: hypothetical protein K0S82_88 [Gaiellaceae bacterium]|nr:hypothetical protein [Gaiellaceae bacterium]